MICTGGTEILKFFYHHFKTQNGGIILGTLAVTGLIALGVGLFSFGASAIEKKTKLGDMTKYGDISASGDPGSDHIKNNKILVEVIVEGGKFASGVYDDTGLLLLVGESGAFSGKKKAPEEKSDEDLKIKISLEKNDLPFDPLTTGITKIIKNKIENNSSTDTSPEKIDEMLIEVMKDIEEMELLIDDERIDSKDAKDPKSTLDMVTHINQILAINKKLADQKTIDLKTKLSKAESENKYLESLLQAFEDSEKTGAFQTDGISSLKTRIDENNQITQQLIAQIQQQEDSINEMPENEIAKESDLAGKTETTVTVKLELTLSANPNPVTLGEAVSFSTNITNKDYTYKWNLGDGTKLDEVGLYKTEHIYSLEGMYPISVEIYDGKGERAGKATQNVTVAPPEVTETTPSNSEIVGTWIVQSDVYFYHKDWSVSYVIVTFVLNGDGTCSYEHLPVILREPSEEIEWEERQDLAAKYKLLNPAWSPPEYESGQGTYIYLGKGQYFEESKVGAATMLYTSASLGQYERSDSIFLLDDGKLIFLSTVFTKK